MNNFQIGVAVVSLGVNLILQGVSTSLFLLFSFMAIGSTIEPEHLPRPSTHYAGSAIVCYLLKEYLKGGKE